jgi:prenyltransferase beta subunit
MDPSVRKLSGFFYKIIGKLYNNEYPTIESLQTIFTEIDNLPTDFLTLHHNHVDRVRKIIISFGNSGILTYKHKLILIKSFKNICQRIQVMNYIKENHQNLINKSDNPNKIIKQIKVTDDRDREISQVVFTLIIDLSRDIMTSTLNNIIFKYLAVMEIFLNENCERYSSIDNDILECLIKHGWKNGFVKEPKIKELIFDLEKIVNKYF